MSLLAGDMAYWTAKHFIDLMDGRNGETTRKVCLTLLNTLIDGRHSQPLSLTALKGGKTKLPPEFLAACQSAKPSATKRKRTIKAVPIE